MNFDENFHKNEMLKIYDGESHVLCEKIPAIRAMMNLSKDKSPCFFVTDNLICSNLVQLFSKVIPVFCVAPE